jgi:hypothetical protein
MSSAEEPMIDAVLTEFLAEQRERLSNRTYRNYDYVIELLRRRLDGYGPTRATASAGSEPTRRVTRRRFATCPTA